MTADDQGGYVLTNACPVCRTAIVLWCDGDGHLFDVPGQKSLQIPSCRGVQVLQSDVPCEQRH